MNCSPGKNGWFALVVLMAAITASGASIPVQSFKASGEGVTLAMSPGTMKLTVCSDGIVRVEYSPAGVLPAGQDLVVTNH